LATFFIENFGCRATEADTAALGAGLLQEGLSASNKAVRADFIVLNTCTVTAAADAQAREAIRKIHRANPTAKIVVTGCYAQRAAEEIAALEGVSWVVGNARQQQIPELLAGAAKSCGRMRAGGGAAAGGFVPLADLEEAGMSLERGPAKILSGDIFEQTTVQLANLAGAAGARDAASDRTRPILKIQDGCNNRCAYCVIPFVRGRSRSLPPDAVVKQARQLAAAGVREIVLSGINLGSYGRDLSPRADLAGVVRRILQETPIEHLRLSSIEPQDITVDFVARVAESERVARHFHVPLQSGANRILRAMHRWYRAELYAERIGLIRRLLPDAAIGADVIVGFPGESEQDSRETVEFIQKLPLTYLHVFSFSARPGTKAKDMGGAVRPEEIRERARELRSLSAKKSVAFRAGQAGRMLRALTLHRQGDNWTEALTRNYLKVRIAGQVPANEWREVVLAAREGEICAVAETAGSVFENHVGEGQVAAMSDRERDIFHAQAAGNFPGDACEV
jgi:threonylcarbamoyladenosine tRNA methylthiotransferase MtaB